MNDISLLLPVPSDGAGIKHLVSAATVLDSGASLWPEESFKSVLDAALKSSVKGSLGKPHSIEFRNPQDLNFRKRENRKMEAFRIDLNAAPSLGTIPQIRLVMQPVGMKSGNVHAFDYAAHLVFNFVANPSPPSKPDLPKFRAIIADLVALKTELADGSPAITADGVLPVHPGYASPKFDGKMRDFLSKHVALGDPALVPFMGVDMPQADTWMFFNIDSGATVPSPLEGGFPKHSAAPVLPSPRNTNINKTQGASTRVLFSILSPEKLKAPAIAGLDKPLIEDIPNFTANPNRSNVSSTDCVSCHSETTRRTLLKLTTKSFAFPIPAGVGNVSPAVLPSNNWNFRNFGWFNRTVLEGPKAFATMRTGNETANALEFMHLNYQSQYEVTSNPVSPLHPF